MSYDVDELRAHFPSLASGIAHFDGPGGTQTPREVGEAVAAVLTGPLSNRGTSVASESNADAAVGAFRAAFADLLGVPEAGVVHGRSATALTYDLSRALARTWRPGDEVVVTRLDHDANVSPWLQAAAAAGVEVRWLDFDPATAELDEAGLAAVLGDRTRLVAVTAASNLLGTMPDVRAVADAAHAVGAHVHVDGVHYTAHEFVDVAALGADTFVCSPYKFLGPHCGVLAADPAVLGRLQPDKLAPSTDDVPERFELGTLPYEVMAGAAAAVDFLAGLTPQPEGTSRRDRLAAGFAAVDAHENRLRIMVENALDGFGDDVVLHSRAARRTPTLLVSLPGRGGEAAAGFLAERDVLAPAGYFYAYRAGLRLDLPDLPIRIGLAPYTSDDDVARLLDGLAAFLK